jgi:hypothetical protein
MNRLVVIFFVVTLSGCADKTPFQVLQGIMGYQPPPLETTVGEELVLEFKRCEKIDRNRNCAQIAYDMVRTVKGLEPRKVPKGVVIILEGDVKMNDPSPASDAPPGYKEN